MTTIWKHQFFGAQPSLWYNFHIQTWLWGKSIVLTIWTFVGKVMCLLFNMLSRFAIAFLPRSKCLLISGDGCNDFGAPQNKVCHCFHCFPIYLPWSDGTGCHDLSFLKLSFKPTFSLSSFTFIKRLFRSLLSAIRGVSSAYLGLMFLPTLLTYFICWSLSWEQGPSSGKRKTEKGASPAVCTQKASF